jgi:tripartite-type tricarboxylate transporter receptor subunit TctC
MTWMKWMRIMCAFGGIALMPLITMAQQYPSKPIRIIIGLGAGGTADALSRYFAQKLSTVLNTSVIVENKPGAGQLVAINSMMGATPDGYTLSILAGSAFGQGPALRKGLPYDPLKDFSIIGVVARAPGVIVISKDLPVRSLRELVNYSVANPNKLNYASAGMGAASHLQVELLVSLTGLKITHIPYKADADIMRELTGGTVQLGMSPIQGAMAHIASGNVRALAVSGSRRSAALPDVPSLAESDFKGLEGVDPYSYYGFVGPKGLSPALISTLNEATNRVLKIPEVVSYMQERLYMEPGAGSPAAFRAYIEKDLAKWRTLSNVIKLAE